jgi:FHS family Na+ dependent glucose MFS transporter 1
LKSRLPYAAAYYSIMLAVGLIAGTLGPSLPNLAENTKSTLQAASIILAMRPAGYLLGTLLSGRAMDRMPGHPVLAIGLLLASLMLFLTPQMGGLAALSTVIFLLGFSDGVMDVGINTLLPWVYGEKSGPYFNGLHFAFGVGALAAPLLVAKSLTLDGKLGWGYGAMALALLPVALWLFFLPSPSRHEPEPGTSASDFDWKSASLFSLIFLAYGGAEAGYGAWIFSYATQSGLEDAQGGARLTSLFWGALTLGRLAAIGLALRFSLRSILAADAVGSVASLGALLLWPDSRAALWLGSAGCGLFLASFFPTLLAFAATWFSKSGRISGRLTSLFFVGSSSGSILIPWLIGQGFESRGPQTAILALFAATLLMGLGLAALLRKN